MDIIEIAGERVSLFGGEIRPRKRDNEYRRVSLSELLATVNGNKNGFVETPILPAGTRYYFKQGDKEVVVFEQMPQTRTIKIGGKFRLLAFPFLIYFFYFWKGEMPNYSSRIFYRNSTLTSTEDKLYLCNLTHQIVKEDSDLKVGTVCMSAHPPWNDPIEKKVEANMSYYWETRFRNIEGNGNDFFQGFQESQGIDEKVSTIEAWEEISKKDPLSILTVPWLDSNLTVKDVLKEMLGDNGNRHQEENQNIRKFSDLIDAIYRIREV